MRRRAPWRTTAVALGTVLAIAGIGACTSGTSSSDSSAQGQNGAPGSAAGAERPAASAAASAAPAMRSSGGGGASLSDVSFSRAEIRTATMTVAVKHGQSVASKADAADAIALRTGGEVDTDDRTSGAHATATIVLRVPPADLAEVLTELSKLGVEKSRSLSIVDVTTKVADVASRVNSARVAIATLRELYQRAKKVSDVITIESQLAERESNLEALEAQQRSLSTETSTAAITLSLISQRAAVKPAVQHHHRSGFIGGLLNGWDAFTGAAYGLSTGLGAVLPFAVLLIVLGLAGRLLWPRLRTVRSSPPANPPISE